MDKGNKIVSFINFKPLDVSEVEKRVTDFATGRGMGDQILGWGGRGNMLPFFVVLCSPELAGCLETACTSILTNAARVFVEDEPKPAVCPKPPSP